MKKSIIIQGIIVVLLVAVLACAVSAFTCGDNLVVSHTAGAVAPVTKSVTYGTVATDITGSDQCWITQNLGADQQATYARDATEASAGWYWQFNRKQGYKHDGSTRTPSSTWITSIDEDSNWMPANDPCTIELGEGWRLPTYTEWFDADANENWDSRNKIFDSVLKLHASGHLLANTGNLNDISHGGRYWSSTQGISTKGYLLYSYDLGCFIANTYKAYGYSIRCLMDVVTLPNYSNFTSEETTNFSDVTLSSVTSLTLAIDNKGKISFPLGPSINSEDENYDANVKIEDALIYVNSAALDSSFNSSATLTFENVNCNFPYVYYSETASTRLAILTENNQCLSPRCMNIQCSDGTLTVNVSHFSGYAVNGNASLAIDADDPKYPSQEMHFTAYYRNSTNGFISGATCTIYLPDGSNPMDEGNEIYTYNQTYDTAQTVEYNVTCNKAGHSTVTANDTALVSANIPEFSTITLGLGLIAVLAGLIVMRKRR